jgi:diguanylate cyclase (GGDEF)-like protein/PAS domain S-box-containing protein
MADQAFELLMVVDGARAVRWANAAFQRMLGYTPEALIGLDFLELVHREDAARPLATIGRLGGQPGAHGTADFRVRAADGSWRLMETSATNLLTDPAIGGFVVALRDVTERVEVMRELEVSEERYSALVERAQDGIYTADRTGRLTSVNPGAERLTGYRRDELLGMNILDLIAPEERAAAQALLQRSPPGTDAMAELQLIAKGGRRVFIEVRGRVVASSGEPGHIEGIVRDTTERHRLEHELRHEATHDTLTGLPNRALFFDRLTQALSRSSRSRGRVVVMLLDVDDFKLVNDSLGHAAGDELLVELSRRLRALLRGGETVARLGGDEFALVAEGMTTEHEIEALAKRVIAGFATPFAIGDTRRRLTCSLGIAVASRAEPSDLLRDADTAMYRVKATNRGGYAFFDAELRTRLLRRLELARGLEDALARDSLEVHYQPIVSVAGGEVLAVEALVRWQHPQWGWVAPSEFVPLAEEHGLIVALGRMVLDKATRALAQWREVAPGALPLGVFVNVSQRELSRSDFVTNVHRTLRERNLEPSDLAFELTERILVEESDTVFRANVDSLIRSGISLDDFGTGFSSLASLKLFPLMAIKIDRYFIGMIESPRDRAEITRAVVGLGRALGLMVIAEGVESDVQFDYQRRLGCDGVQGFFLARPKPASEIAPMLGARLLPGPTPLGAATAD